jgi:hypothetical protein
VLLADDSSPEVAAVKVVLATVVLGLAGYQAVLAAVLYGRLRSSWLARRVAARAHRLVGATTTALMVAVGAVCVSAYGVGDAIEDGGTAAVHAVAGSLVLVLLAVKIVVVHRGPRAGRALPALGIAVLGLVAVTWGTSALPVLT